MAPSTTPIPPPVIPPHPKTKRQIPAGIQTNGAPSSSSPSPSMSAKKPPNSAKQAPNSASANGGTVTVARPPNRVRQEITAQPNGATRPGTNGATQPTPTGAADPAMTPVDVQQRESHLQCVMRILD